MNLKCIAKLMMKTIALVLVSPLLLFQDSPERGVLQGAVMLISFVATAAFAAD